MFGIFSANFPTDAVKNTNFKYVKLTKLNSYQKGCVVIASQLNSVFNVQAFTALDKSASMIQQQMQELSDKILNSLQIMKNIEVLQEKREICLKVLNRTRQNLNYSAMEAWQQTGVGVQDIIPRDYEIYEQDRQMQLNQLLQSEEEVLLKLKDELIEMQNFVNQI